MPVSNLAILVKMSGGLLPPNSRAGDVEIYDNGRMLIFESDTDIVERQIDRNKVMGTLQYCRETGFFQLPNIIHDSGASPNVPDVTLSVVDSMGNNTVTMTSYQRLKGEMRKSPFDLIYKRITDLAWESYTNGVSPAAEQATATPIPPTLQNSPAPAPLPQAVQSQVPPLPFSKQGQVNAPNDNFDLPSLDDLLKSSGLQFDAPEGANSAPGLPPLNTPSMSAPAPAGGQRLPPLNQPMAAAASNQPPSLPSLDSVFKQPMPQQQPAQPPQRPPAPKQQAPKPQPVQPAPQQQAAPPTPKQQKPVSAVQPAPPQQPKQQTQQPQEMPVQETVNQQPEPQQPVQSAPTRPDQPKQEQKQRQEQPRQNTQPPRPPQEQPTRQEEQRPRQEDQQARPPRNQQPEPVGDRSQPEQRIENVRSETPRQPQREDRRSQQAPRQAPVAAMAPQRKPPVAWEHTQEAIERLEESLHGKVLVFYAAQAKLAMEDMRYLYSHLRKLGRKKSLFVIPFIQDTDSTVVWRMATLIREFCEEMHVILPEESTMATTMFALAADSILMNPFGFLSPIDTTFSHMLLQKALNEESASVPISEIFQASATTPTKTVKQKDDQPAVMDPSQSPFHPLVTAAAARQFALTQRICTNLMKLSTKNKRSDTDIAKIITQLTQGYPSAHYPIVYFEAQTLGLPVSETNEAVNDVLWELVKEYVYITQPVIHYQNDTKSFEKQNIIVESTGRRTIHYSEEMTGKDNKPIEEHTRWRELTQQISVNAVGKESSQLLWKELQLVGSNEN